ncbi:hypothetical protein Nepgr_001737 [Nepenthes gracilis]|uniref:Uncharacterized protein n=1 Tax=Nepenthes gracilis TaxID=150966 RepID=A0AAD3RXU2_NEPGR|nr:hypothetical protein Nepgr_001737 [Nepenthes gracilis]
MWVVARKATAKSWREKNEERSLRERRRRPDRGAAAATGVAGKAGDGRSRRQSGRQRLAEARAVERGRVRGGEREDAGGRREKGSIGVLRDILSSDLQRDRRVARLLNSALDESSLFLARKSATHGPRPRRIVVGGENINDESNGRIVAYFQPVGICEVSEGKMEDEDDDRDSRARERTEVKILPRVRTPSRDCNMRGLFLQSFEF